MEKITVNEVRTFAQKVLDGQAYDSWETIQARLGAKGFSAERIEKARARDNSARQSQEELARRVLAVNVSLFEAPPGHGGDFHKELFRTAAAAWFGFDVKVEFPFQSLVMS